MSSALAIHGGTPVRSTPLPHAYIGAGMYGEEEKRAVMEVLDRQSPFRYYGPDPAWKVTAFERGLAAMTGSAYALGVSSGTAALIVALKALGIGPGDKVILPANTFLASAGAVVAAGAVPVFADIDDSLNIDPDEIDRLADGETKAVMPVHILGNPCRMDRVMAAAQRHGLHVVEDAAQACGASYRGQAVGSIGDIGCFSLQMNKLITTGEGGAVVTDNPVWYERAVRYHDHGMFREREGFLGMQPESEPFLGQNYRMTEIAGAIADEQLKKLERMIAAMRIMKRRIKQEIAGIAGLRFRTICDDAGDAASAIMLLLPGPAKAQLFREALQAENIACSYLYGGRPVYMLPQLFRQRTVDPGGFPFNRLADRVVYAEGMCPVAEALLPCNAVISLSPLFAERDAEDIVTAIRKVSNVLL